MILTFLSTLTLKDNHDKKVMVDPIFEEILDASRITFFATSDSNFLLVQIVNFNRSFEWCSMLLIFIVLYLIFIL